MARKRDPNAMKLPGAEPQDEVDRCAALIKKLLAVVLKKEQALGGVSEHDAMQREARDLLCSIEQQGEERLRRN